jgi:hypothetical protein
VSNKAKIGIFEKFFKIYYNCHSKAKGDQRVKYKKGPIAEEWESKIVNDTKKSRKVQIGPTPRITAVDCRRWSYRFDCRST